MNLRRLLILTAATLLGGMLTACSGGVYRVQGRVIEGPRSMVLVVPDDDPRLQQPGVAGAAIDLMIDPQSLGRKPGGSEVSMPDGSFAVPVSQFGAGLLEFQLGVTAFRNGYSPTEQTVVMPNFNKRLLIMMIKGHNSYRRPEDPFDAIKQIDK